MPMPFSRRSPTSVFHASDSPVPSLSKFGSEAAAMEVTAIRIDAKKMAPRLPAIWLIGSESGQPLRSLRSIGLIVAVAQEVQDLHESCREIGNAICDTHCMLMLLFLAHTPPVTLVYVRSSERALHKALQKGG